MSRLQLKPPVHSNFLRGGLSSDFGAIHVFTTTKYGKYILIWHKACELHMEGQVLPKNRML